MTRDSSFEEVLASHGAMIWRIAAAHEADASLREDLVQDILYALWRALPSFRGESPVRAFVAKLAINRSVSHVQRAVRDRTRPQWPDEPADAAASPEAQAIAANERARLLAAVRALPMNLKEPTLLAMEGLGPADMARVLGISANAVAVRMSRARAALRASMGGKDGTS